MAFDGECALEIGIPAGAFTADQPEAEMSWSFGVPFRGGLLLIAMVLFVTTVAIPAPPAAKTELTAEEIVARTIEERGGLEKLRSIQTLRESGHVTAGANRGARVTRERKRPGRMRLEFTVQGVTSVQVFDGQHGWRMSPLEGHIVPQPLPEEVEDEAAEEADIDGPLIDWKAKGHKVEYAGRETINDNETYKLKVTRNSGPILHIYVDVESFRRVRAESIKLVRGRTVQVQVSYMDHRRTDGILFPHLIEVEAVGRPQKLRVVVDTVEINPPLDDERFDMWDADE